MELKQRLAWNFIRFSVAAGMAELQDGILRSVAPLRKDQNRNEIDDAILIFYLAEYHGRFATELQLKSEKILLSILVSKKIGSGILVRL